MDVEVLLLGGDIGRFLLESGTFLSSS